MVDIFQQTDEGTNATVYQSSFQASDILDIDAGTGITYDMYKDFQVLRVRSSTAGACDITADPQIEAPDNGNPIIEIHGTDDTRTVQLDDGDGLTLINGSVILGNKNVLILRYIDGSWIQVAPELEATPNIDNTVYGAAWNGSTNAPTQDRVYDKIEALDGEKSDIGHTHTASEITDFDTEVSNNTDVAANTLKLAGIEAGAEVNTVDSVNTKTGAVVLDADDISDTSTTHKFTTASDISKLSGIEASADVTDATNVDAAGAVMNSDTTTAAMQFVVDEDDMASNLATKVPTQQSVKAYVDANIGTPTLQAMGNLINSADSKTTPVDGDMVGLMDSEATNLLKKLSWSNIKATLKTYFDGLYNNYVHPNHTGDVTSSGDGATTIANKAVTLAKMDDMATASLIYRKTTGTGVPEVNTLATLKTDLGLTGTNSGDSASIPIGYLDTNTSLGTSDVKVPSQNAVKTYADQLISSANALVYKGTIACAGNPNYPAASAGELYIVSTAGKIGGASGVSVDVGDMAICNTDSTSSGDQAAVGTKWNIIEKNIVGAVTGPSSATDGNLAVFDSTTGKIIKDGGAIPTGNATHTGDATGATELTVVKIQGKSFPTLGAGDDGKYPKYDNGTNAFVMTSVAGAGDMILANSQSVTGLKTFDKDKLAMKGTSTGVTTISTANTSATNYTATLPAATGTIALTTSTVAKATTLETPRAIYGNNFDGSAALTQVIASTYGGTGNGYTKFTGPATSEKTFTLPNTDATLVTTDATQTLTGKTLTSPLFSGSVDGWISAGETWTYASASTFTISGDQTGKYQKGDKIKLTQTTTKYFYIIGVSYGAPNTTVTVAGGSDYTIANATITNPYYSKHTTPQGFPTYFNWTPSFTGFSSDPANGIYRFCLNGTSCLIDFAMPNNGTSNANTFRISLPVVATTITNMQWITLQPYAVDNGSALTTRDYMFILSAGTDLYLTKGGSSTGWTTSGEKGAFGNIRYEI